MNYLQKKKLAFMSIVNRVKGFVRTITGALPLTLEGCVDEESIIDYTLYGQSVQNGTPTPDTPIEVESVGEYEETTGKYKIPIIVSYGTRNITTNIYLDEPLRKVGDYADYIKSVDLKTGKGTVVRKVGVNKLLANSNISFTKASTGSSTMNRYFYTPKPRIKLAQTSKGVGYCTVLRKDYEDWNAWTKPQIYFSMANNSIGIVVPINIEHSYPAIYNYLSSNGENEVVIYYQLATPTEIPITLPNLPTFKGTSIISADTTVQPSNAEIEYYSNVKE